MNGVLLTRQPSSLGFTHLVIADAAAFDAQILRRHGIQPFNTVPALLRISMECGPPSTNASESPTSGVAPRRWGGGVANFLS